jgi:putative transposase
MSRRAYSEVNLHITWHTKGNLPLIVPAIEAKLYDFLRKKMLETHEVFVHAIGGIENHVHLTVSVPPTVQPAE